jgi:hypothetical protein
VVKSTYTKKAGLLLLLALGASSTSACTYYAYCACTNSDGSYDNAHTATVCKGYGQREGNWFAPQSSMVMTPKIKSVWNCITLGTTVNGGKSAARQGQQATIPPAGVRANASTILQVNLLSQFEQQ